MITFIRNIISEEANPDLVMNPKVKITTSVVTERLFSRCNFDLTEIEVNLITSLVSKQSLTVKQKLFYKNNLMQFIDNEEILDSLSESLIVDNFPNPGKPPEELTEVLQAHNELLRYFVAYPYPYNNKTEHASVMKRKVVLVCDTDSNFIYVYPILRKIVENANLKVEELDKLQRVSVVSGITNFMTYFIKEVFSIFCTNCNVPQEHHYRIDMKSEIHYKRVIITKNKKSYAGIMLSKEGNIYENPKFDVRGIQIKKISTPKNARIFFSKLLEDKMLKSENIDISDIYRDYRNFAQSIGESVISANPEYLKPITLKSASSYKMPYQQQSVRSSLLWNTCYPKEFISDNSSFKVLELKGIPLAGEEHVSYEEKKDENGVKVKVKVFNYTIREEFVEFINSNFSTEIAGRLLAMFEAHPLMLKYGIAQIAIPTNVDKIPEEFLKYSDIGSVTNSVMSKGNILLESLGFALVKSRSRQLVSNMIRV